MHPQTRAGSDQHQAGQVFGKPQRIVQRNRPAHGVPEQHEGRISLTLGIFPQPVHVAADAISWLPVGVTRQVHRVSVSERGGLVVVGEFVLAGAVHHYELHRSSSCSPLE